MLSTSETVLPQDSNTLSRGLGTVVLLILVVWTVDGLFLQTQMALFRDTPLPNFVVRVFLTLVVLAVGFSRVISGQTTPVPRSIFRLWVAFLIYLIVETLLLVVRFGYPADYVIFNHTASYFAILLLPVMFYLRGILDESRIVRVLIVFFIPLGLFGIAQNFSSSRILPTDSPNGYLQVMSWDFLGSVRAFSFFQSPSYFGHFIALVAGLGAALYFQGDKGKKKAVALALLALVSGFSTMTRATQIEIACVLLTVWMLYRRARYRRLLSLLPVIYGILGIFVAFGAPILFQDISGDNIFSNWSIFERYLNWAHYGALWIGNGLPSFLFGAGIAQNDRFRPGQDVLIDNSFIGIGVYIGAVGLVLWFLITWQLWKYMLNHSTAENISPVRAAAVGTWSVWLFCSVFNILLFAPLPFLVFLFSNTSWVNIEPSSHLRRRGNPSQSHIVGTGEGPVADPA